MRQHEPSGSLTTIAPELLTTREAAQLLRIGERTLWRYSNSRVAPAPIKIGNAIRYQRTVLLAWIADGCPDLRKKEGRQ